jgi:biopolymer transport protein ExbD
MAQLDVQPNQKGSKQRIHAMPKIDMTPMVDLGFLLITFFIFTTTLSEKNAAQLIMPDTKGTPVDLKSSHALTFLLGENNKLYSYEGDWHEAIIQNRVKQISYDEYQGLGKVIRSKKKDLTQSDGADKLMCIIKPLKTASYKNIIDVLDEMTINNVSKYAIVDPTGEESSFDRMRN